MTTPPVKGVTTVTFSDGNQVSNEDSCTENAVREYFCDGDENADAALSVCEYGCEQGACLPALPDLTIEDVTIFQHADSGQIAYNIRVKNNGHANLLVNGPGRISLSNVLIDENGNQVESTFPQLETTLMSCDASTFCIEFETIPAGETIFMYGISSFTIQEAIDRNATGIRVKADSRNTHIESNEENNTLDIPIPPEFFSWTSPPSTEYQEDFNSNAAQGIGER